jgi:hypothetical protein
MTRIVALATGQLNQIDLKTNRRLEKKATGFNGI